MKHIKKSFHTDEVHWMTSRQLSPSPATKRNHSPASLALHNSFSKLSSSTIVGAGVLLESGMEKIIFPLYHWNHVNWVELKMQRCAKVVCKPINKKVLLSCPRSVVANYRQWRLAFSPDFLRVWLFHDVHRGLFEFWPLAPPSIGRIKKLITTTHKKKKKQTNNKPKSQHDTCSLSLVSPFLLF